MCIFEVWKTRLWSLSSVWTRAVQLEDETNQHLALVPFKWEGGEGESRWWFQISFIFTPIPGEMIQFDEHIFQRGWFNHQLGIGIGGLA